MHFAKQSKHNYSNFKFKIKDRPNDKKYTAILR